MAKFYYASGEMVKEAIESSLRAKKDWDRVPFDDRVKMFLKVADAMAGEKRADLNASTMLGQSKTVIQVI